MSYVALDGVEEALDRRVGRCHPSRLAHSWQVVMKCAQALTAALQPLSLHMEADAEMSKLRSRLQMNKLLLDACHHGDLAAVEQLVDDGADVDMAAQGGVTALMLACLRGHAHVVQLICERGANIDQTDNDGDTALMRACRQGHVFIALLLCSFGAERELSNKHGVSAVDDADACNSELHGWLLDTWLWTTPLHYLEILTPQRALTLLQGGANVHVRPPTAHGPTPLELARELEYAGRASAGSPAALVLGWWRARLLAIAMGTHPRLGRDSPVHKLAGMPELLAMVATQLAAREEAQGSEGGGALDASDALRPLMAAVALGDSRES